MVLWAKAEGIQQQTCLDPLKRTWKTSIWSGEDDEEMTLPAPEVPLVYSLHYAQQGRQDWEDELPVMASNSSCAASARVAVAIALQPVNT